MSAESVIAVARGELGYTETGNNITKYWQEYDPSFQGQPWCVAFLWWVFNHAGESAAFFGGGKTASCGTLLRWYQAMGQTVPVSEVQPGDIVLLNFNGRGTADHCGIVERKGGVCLYTIEGNTTPGLEGSQDNGGSVAQKMRYYYQIVAVCRPHYKPKEEPMKDDITGHWAADDIRWCMERGILKGYPDGSFQPDKPVTRAEMAVICKRMYAYTVEADITGLREDIARLKDAR